MNTYPFVIKNPLFTILINCLILSIFWFGSPLVVFASSVGCDDEFVQLANAQSVIEVSPTGTDDTVNIQCALDMAKKQGIPTVRLGSATYFISAIAIDKFNGTFEGKTTATTTLQVLDHSVDCMGMDTNGLRASAIRFSRGEPRVRFMTIKAALPCVTDFQMSSILRFTGEPAFVGNCKNDVIFATVDRVMIDGTGSTKPRIWSGIQISPEGRLLETCKDTLLGTFKLNRSSVVNIYAGLKTVMKSLAQVDINFNEFKNNHQAINIYDSNQSTTITGNTFIGGNSATENYAAIQVNNLLDNPPPSTRVVIHNNRFTVTSLFTETTSRVIKFGWFTDGPVSAISAVITNNTFNLNDTRTYGIRAKSTSNTHVSANTFNGSGARAIYVYGEVPVTGWTITANKGLATFVSDRTEDIRLSSATSNCIIGPGQGSSIQDDGSNNTILPQ